jgi:hypothetical protein
MYMQSPLDRSSSSRSESRWSGRPATTAVSQVPQTPRSQEESTVAPARRAASSTLTPGATVTCAPERRSSTSKAASPAFEAAAFGSNRSVRSEYPGHPAQSAATASSSRDGPQQ